MPQVKFTHHLQRFFPDLPLTTHTKGSTVANVIATLNQTYPGLAGYLVDDSGALRKHVLIFIGDAVITDRTTLQDAVNDTDHLFIFQALSGG